MRMDRKGPLRQKADAALAKPHAHCHVRHGPRGPQEAKRTQIHEVALWARFPMKPTFCSRDVA